MLSYPEKEGDRLLELDLTWPPAAYAYRDGPAGGWILRPGLEPGLALGFQF